MKLHEHLPNSVMFGKKRVKLDLDFRNVLRMMEILARDDLMPEARDWNALRCICKRPKPGMMEEVKKLLFANPPKNDGKRHVGIENVRQRLFNMCEGTLTIESEVGVGTLVTIKIPKEG